MLSIVTAAGLQLPARPWEALPPGTGQALSRHRGALPPLIIDAIRRGVPAYARPLTGAFGEGVRRGVDAALDQFLALIDRPPGAEVPGRGVARALGAGEAREGRSLEALLAAYRLGARVAWRHVAQVAREEALGEATLALLAESIFAYVDELSAESAEGYAREQSAAAGEAERRRRALATLLMARPPADPATVAELARAARWDLPANLAAAVWRREDGDRLAAHLPHGTLPAALPEPEPGAAELACALIPDPEAPGRAAELERTVGDRLVALGPPVAPVAAALSARRAAAVLRLPEARTGLVRAADHLAELLLHADPALAGELAAQRLEPLAGLSPAVRARQADTLRAWLDHQGNVPAAARALAVHPQTVRYRLAQLREAFGPALEDPRARFELLLVLHGPRRV